MTDAKDRRTLASILDIFYTDQIFDDGYRFSPSGAYYAPGDTSYEGYQDYIRSLPISAAPEVFGLHANADITKDQQEAEQMLVSILSTQGRAQSGGGRSPDEVLSDLAADIENRIPPEFDIEAARFKYPVDYHESMNTVLTQELFRFNKLVSVISSSLKELQKALKGLVVMSAELESVGNAMFDGRVPELWMGQSYPSLKPLGSYVNDLIERLHMLRKWIEHGPPPVFWISGFFFTHAFLTGVKQNYARKYKIPIDTVTFEYEALPKGDYHTKPEDGAYVDGMYLEGAKWDFDSMKLAEADPKVGPAAFAGPHSLCPVAYCVLHDQRSVHRPHCA